MKKIREIFKNNIGVTLIELIVTVIILGIISGSIYKLYYDSQHKVSAERKNIEAQAEVNKSIQLIIDDLRRVESEKLTSNPNNCIEVNSSNNMLIIHYENNLGNISEQIAYGVNSNKLYRYKLMGNKPLLNFTSSVTLGSVIANNVTSFSIVNQGTYYEVDITVDPPNVGKNKTRPISLSTKFTPRFYEIR